ncbi:type IV secretion system protein TraC [Testudinibacter sp. TR-2022]|uniref:type IV secretion system protein TraC n=1 Tax=Testudinibacter sp. TR-2022 TaxID=2585029 RepID=UPI001119BD9E|nr:type IV secretion system protein TraC [Testudinibacter sp. TR-2022]TNH04043.1 type IV secretion system protein TraC [Pasteurellaceae bacterium Phil31]TNH10172.1 type IV secretion system protein TraC [Testudinibacter sp. TR-2022]TNH13032.1 type IV secretion system protein TraC [Testudinibacter sp. TR-2022]
MKFNPLDLVKMIDKVLGEKETINETENFIKELEYPHLSDLVPSRFYDNDNQLFVNRKSVGFILEAQPLIGANESLVEGLERILQGNLPRTHSLQIIMLGSQAVKESLEFGLKDFSWKGYRADDCNQLTHSFYLNGAENTLQNLSNDPLTLRNYRLFFIYSMVSNHLNDTTIMRVKEVRSSLLSSLKTNGLYVKNIGINQVCALYREIINFQYGKLSSYSDEYFHEKEVCRQVVDSTMRYFVKPSHIQMTMTDNRGIEHKTRSVGLHLDRNPSVHYLWQNGNIISDLFNTDRGILCPFIFTMVIATEEDTKSQGEANRKFFDLDKKANSAFSKFIPSTVREFNEWSDIRNKLLSGTTSISNYYMGIRFFCADNDDMMMRELERVKKAFESQGLPFVRSDFMQMRDFIASLPFSLSDNPKLWDSFKKTGGVQRAETFHAVNLMPLVGDNKLSQSGIVLPSYRNQIAFLDVFDESLPTTNFNWFESGTSGAGKSVLSQSIGRQVLDSGGILSIFDIGDSYKAFCSSVGGNYINGSNLRFNPFANVLDINSSAARIRDQLCILASPNGLLDEVHESLILDAITEQWTRYKQGMRIDHVVDYLKSHKNKIEGIGSRSNKISDRVDEIVALLSKYTTKGIYGDFFNSDKPTLSQDLQFVVTELGDLKQSGDLLMAVLFTLMIWVENVMYSTPRSLRKMNIIDEGWKLLGSKSPKTRSFVEEGYRTVRRHNGSFGTVTQSIGDKNLSTAALAAYDNSSFKFTMMQDAKAFESFKEKEPTIFSELEYDLIKKFPPARRAGYSSVLVNMGAYSSFHRLLLDPLTNELFSSRGDDFTYREKRLAEGADIKDILFEMAAHKDKQLLDYLMRKEYA